MICIGVATREKQSITKEEYITMAVCLCVTGMLLMM